MSMDRAHLNNGFNVKLEMNADSNGSFSIVYASPSNGFTAETEEDATVGEGDDELRMTGSVDYLGNPGDRSVSYVDNSGQLDLR